MLISVTSKHFDSIIKKRDNMLSKIDFCTAMRNTNTRQRALLLEAIHNISENKTLRIFHTGVVGFGKTFTLRLLMEIFNRYILL